MLLLLVDDARGDDPLPDAIPTEWQRQVHAEGLLTAPPPPNPVTICVVDTGVTPTPDLDITARYAFDGGTLDDVTAKPGQPGHGTTVAHFAAAAVNGWGGAGIFPYARIASVRVFPEQGGAAWQDYITSFDRCRRIDPGTKVVLMSLGSQLINPREARELEDRIRLARLRDGLNVVVAAGNGGGAPDFPGRFADAFTVGAVGPDDELCVATARGDGVDLTAPGCGLVGYGWDGSPYILDGTSFAAPMVAGLLAALRTYEPELGVAAAEALLRQESRGGRLDAEGIFTRPTPASSVTEGEATEFSSSAGAPSPEAMRPQDSHEDVRVVPGTDQRRTSLAGPVAVLVRQTPRSRIVRIKNWPPSARLEMRFGDRRRTITRHSELVRVPRRSIRLRYRRGRETSVWTSVLPKPSTRSSVVK